MRTHIFDMDLIEKVRNAVSEIFHMDYEEIKCNSVNEYFFDLIEYPFDEVKTLTNMFPNLCFIFEFVPEIASCSPASVLYFKNGKCIDGYRLKTVLIDENGNEEDYIDDDNVDTKYDLDSVNKAFGLI